MYLSNVYVHQGSFPTFCILVFDEIKFYRNESYFPSYFIYRSIEIFLKNDQRFVVRERYLKFEDSHNFFFSRLPSFLFLKIIIFLNFKFSKGEGSKEKYSIGENVLQPPVLLSPPPPPQVTKVATPEGCRRGLLLVPFAGGGGG